MRADTHPVVPLVATVAVFVTFAGCSTQESAPANQGGTATPAVTQRITVVDDYHGFKIADPYRWLEDTTATAPGPGWKPRTR